MKMQYKEFEHVKVFVNGIRLHIRVGGEGTPVLLMHGWLGTSYTWRHVAPKLVEAGYKVLPGYAGQWR